MEANAKRALPEATQGKSKQARHHAQPAPLADSQILRQTLFNVLFVQQGPARARARRLERLLALHAYRGDFLRTALSRAAQAVPPVSIKVKAASKDALRATAVPSLESPEKGQQAVRFAMQAARVRLRMLQNARCVPRVSTKGNRGNRRVRFAMLEATRGRCRAGRRRARLVLRESSRLSRTSLDAQRAAQVVSRELMGLVRLHAFHVQVRRSRLLAMWFRVQRATLALLEMLLVNRMHLATAQLAMTMTSQHIRMFVYLGQLLA